MHRVQAQIAGLALRIGLASLADRDHRGPRLDVVQSPLAIALALAQVVQVSHGDGRQPHVLPLAVKLEPRAPQCAASRARSGSRAPRRPRPTTRCRPACSDPESVAADKRLPAPGRWPCSEQSAASPANGSAPSSSRCSAAPGPAPPCLAGRTPAGPAPAPPSRRPLDGSRPQTGAPRWPRRTGQSLPNSTSLLRAR